MWALQLQASVRISYSRSWGLVVYDNLTKLHQSISEAFSSFFSAIRVLNILSLKEH